MNASAPLRIASYNLRKCRGLDGRRDPGRSLDVINALDADVVALQEADRRLGPRPAALPGRMIEEFSDFRTVALAENDVSLGWHGNAILVRRDLEVDTPRRIPLPVFEPRGAVSVQIGGRLRVVGVHLSLSRRYRRQQLAAIRAALPRDGMATVILGDFNEWSGRRGLEPLDGAFTAHAPGRSFHAARPLAALDRIALSPALELKDAGVVETAAAKVASDHLPVWADVAAA